MKVHGFTRTSAFTEKCLSTATLPLAFIVPSQSQSTALVPRDHFCARHMHGNSISTVMSARILVFMSFIGYVSVTRPFR